ncbi:MAG: hypothetical protein DRJ10_07700, partial [Bacteroidetes bacterium]
MYKRVILNTLVILFAASIIFGFVYANSNHSTVSIEPIKANISNNEIPKTLHSNITNSHNQKNNSKILDFPAPKQGCL